MAKKGGKSSKGKGPSKPKPRKENAAQPGSAKGESLLEEMAGLPPQERITSVRPFWEGLSQEEREALLTVPVEELREYAQRTMARLRKQAAAEAAAQGLAAGGAAADGGPAGVVLDLEPGLDQLLEEAVRRSAEKGTWKVWRWPAAGVELYDSEAFRKYLESELVAPELRALLPREDSAGTSGGGGGERDKESAAGEEGGERAQQPQQAQRALDKPVEKPAEAALRNRMVELLQRVHAANRAAQEEEAQYRRPVGRGARGAPPPEQHPAAVAAAGGVRDINAELITMMMSALEKEHEFLYHLVLYPLTTYLAELLPEGARDSSRTELFYEDLDKLPPEEVARMCEWLTEKLDSFSSKLKPEAKELLEQQQEEEEPIGDVDLFCLTEERAALQVHPKWLMHLQERQLGEDGQPRKVKPAEDPHRLGLLLEWVYGTIVSTAEKARDGAKRSLGSRQPSVESALEQFVTNLRDLAAWEARARTARELLAEMVQSRKEARELAAQHNITPYKPPEKKAAEEGEGQQAEQAGEGGDAAAAAALPGAAPGAGGEEECMLPDAAMLSMLRREVLLTRAKLHYLGYQQMMAERMLRSLKAQLRQGEPEFDRLKREVEEVKAHQRGLDGTYRTAAEMERHRAQLADAAIEEQIEVQTAFREQGQRLQRIYDHRRETELAMARREQEMKQLTSWKQTVMQIITQLEDTLKLSAPLQQLTEEVDLEAQGPDTDAARALVQAVQSVTQQTSQLSKLRQHFHKDIRRQLYGDQDDHDFFDIIKKQLKEIEKRLEDGRAALQHVENFVVNVACDDPGAAVGAQLVLPLLQERLDARALEYAAQRAEQAQLEVIRMEAEHAERERQEREKRAKQKQKVKEKLRSEKEKERAEREARERAEQEQRVEEQLRREKEEEEERRRRTEELEALRRAEEELMERRRQELLADEGSHWRQRMEAERLIAAQAALELELGAAAQTELSDSANEAELPESFQEGAPRALKRRTQQREQPRDAQQQPRRRGGEGEEGGSGHSRPLQQPRYPPGAANGFAPPAPGAAANGYLPAGERARSGRPGPSHRQDGPRQDRHPDRAAGGPQNRAANLPAGAQQPGRTIPLVRGRDSHPGPAKPAAAAQPAAHAAGASPGEASARNQAERAGSPGVPAQGVPAAPPQAPVPSDFPPLPGAPAAHAAPVVAQQEQQPVAAAPAPTPPPAAEPAAAAAQPAEPQAAPAAAAAAAAAEGGEAVAAPPAAQEPPAAASAPTPSAELWPPSAAAAAAAEADAAAKAAAAAAPAPAAAAVPVAPVGAGPAVPVPLPAPVVVPGVVVPPAMAAMPLPGGPVPPGVPMHGPPPHLPPPGRERSGPEGPPVVGPHPLPPGMAPLPPGMPPPPFAGPPFPMPGAPGMPPGPVPIMYFPAPGMPAPQMMGPPGRGPRPAGATFMPMGPGMFPMVPVPMVPGHPGMPMPMQPVPGAPPGPRHSSGHGRSGGSTSLRVTAQPFVPSFQRSSVPGRRAEQQQQQQQQQPQQPKPAPAESESEQQQREPAAPAAVVVPPAAVSSSGAGSSPRGPLEQLASNKSAAALSAASSAAGPALSPDEARSAASDASSSSAAPPALAPEQAQQAQQQAQQQQQQGFAQPPLTTQAVPHRGGPPAPGATQLPSPIPTPSRSSTSSCTPQGGGTPPLRPPPLANLSSGKGAEPSGKGAPGGGLSSLRAPAVAGVVAQPAEQQPAGAAAGVPAAVPASAVSRAPAAPAAAAAAPPAVAAAGPPPPIDLGSLRLVRGLTNGPGLYHCFLNVVVQCLWHLGPFRRALLALPAHELDGRGGAPHDIRVMQALCGVFRALDAPGDGGARPTVSVSALREALTGLRGGAAAAAQFDLGEMHDAAEVLGEMFDSMHRAQLGAAAVAAGDPTLPRRVRVAADALPAAHGAAPAATGGAAGRGGKEAVYISERDPALTGAAAAPRVPAGVWGASGAALAKVKQAPPQQQPTSPHGEGLVMRLFGQEVQVPCASVPAAAAAAAAPAGQHKPSAQSGTVEALQFVRYFHLVPALGVRAAYEAAAKRAGQPQQQAQRAQRFEELLLAAEAGAHHAPAGSAAARVPLARLLSSPQILALGLVWESPQAPAGAISATMRGLSTELDAGRLYAGPSLGSLYDLRCLMCYYRSHYCAFALSEEAGQWLLFDDAHVELVGPWPAVVAAVVAGCMQPAVLFYEMRKQ